MQYLVMPNRILNLEHIAIYDIYKPVPHVQDKRHYVSASDSEKKITHTLYKGTLTECQQFLAALARTINASTEPAVLIEAVLAKMEDEDD